MAGGVRSGSGGMHLMWHWGFRDEGSLLGGRTGSAQGDRSLQIKSEWCPGRARWEGFRGFPGASLPQPQPTVFASCNRELRLIQKWNS